MQSFSVSLVCRSSRGGLVEIMEFANNFGCERGRDIRYTVLVRVSESKIFVFKVELDTEEELVYRSI